MSHADDYFQEVGAIARLIDRAQIERMVDGLAEVRAAQGRLFVLGVGGGAFDWRRIETRVPQPCEHKVRVYVVATRHLRNRYA